MDINRISFEEKLVKSGHRNSLTYDMGGRTVALVLGGVAAALVFAILAMVGIEVVSRGFLGAPTYWVTEYSTYTLVSLSFLGLTYAQHTGSHIQVSFVVEALPAHLRDAMARHGTWLGLFFLAVLTWQMGIFVVSEKINDTRFWGILNTPQWIPEMPVFIGLLCFFGYAMIERVAQRTRGGPLLVIIAAALILALAFGLIALGRRPHYLPWIRIDYGVLLLFGIMTLICYLLEGWKMAIAFAATIVVSAAIFYLLKGAPLPLVGSVLGAGIVLYLILGIQIWAALGMVGMFGLYFLLPLPQVAVVAERSWASLNSFTFTAVPMFVLMGNLLVHSGVTSDLFDSFSKWTGRVRGGLGLAAIGSSGIFAALSGSSIATAATIGQVAGPEMIKRGYSPRLASGTVAAGGTLGILIPPSIPMIIFGTAAGAPVTVLFVAGIVPGLLLIASMVGLVLLWSYAVPGSAPVSVRHTLRERLLSLKGTLPFMVLIAGVMGSIYFGIVTITEAGALSAFFAAFLCLAYRKLTLRVLSDALLDTAKVTSYVLIIVAGAAILSWVVDYLGIPRALVDAIEAANFPILALLLLIGLLYVILGMFLDPISMMLMTLPVTYPLIELAGYNAIWFGVILMMLIEVGLVTPPVGIILFVLRGTLPDVPLRDVILGAFPFVVVILLNIVLLSCFPGIVGWLPAMMDR